MAKITEEKFSEIENDLTRFFRNVALPRFIKAVRDGDASGNYNEVENISEFDFIQEFVEWIEYEIIDGKTTLTELIGKNGNQS